MNDDLSHYDLVQRLILQRDILTEQRDRYERALMTIADTLGRPSVVAREALGKLWDRP